MGVRQADRGDLDAWVDMRIALWPSERREVLLEEAEAILSSPDEVCFMLEVGTDKAGFIEGAVRQGPSARYGHVEGWYVAPEYRRLGHGRELMGRLEQWCLHREICRMTSDTGRAYPISPKAHAGCGFVKAGSMDIFVKKACSAGNPERCAGQEKPESPMSHAEVGKYWDGNADAWTRLSRAGYDVYRDRFNTPAFLEMLPDVSGLAGIDIGCGEGHNTRMLAKRGASVVGSDISEKFIVHAERTERVEPFGIRYTIASAVDLPFRDASFGFATAFMSFMDIPETGRVLAEAFRVLEPGGFLQFSITHPCFDTPHRRNLRDIDGLTYAIEVGDYFRNLEGGVMEWLFGAAPPEARKGLEPFKTPRFTRTVSQWLNMLVDTGFRIERVSEPRPTDESVRTCPGLQDAQVVAYFLHVRARKPLDSSGEGEQGRFSSRPMEDRAREN